MNWSDSSRGHWPQRQTTEVSETPDERIERDGITVNAPGFLTADSQAQPVASSTYPSPQVLKRIQDSLRERERCPFKRVAWDLYVREIQAAIRRDKPQEST